MRKAAAKKPPFRIGKGGFVLLVDMYIQVGIAHFDALCIEHGLDIFQNREVDIPVDGGVGPTAERIAHRAVAVLHQVCFGRGISQNTFDTGCFNQRIFDICDGRVVGSGNLEIDSAGTGGVVVDDNGGGNGGGGFESEGD